MPGFDLNEWLNLLLRWGHVFAGILWVGTTFYFTWLDGRFVELEKAAQEQAPGKAPPEKHIWMVHSGGFYVVEKQKTPQVMPGKLHWFRWEAALTWLTGILLFVLVYYHAGLMVDFEDARMSQAAAKDYLGAIQASLQSPNMILDLRIPQNATYEGTVLDTALAQFLAGEITRDGAAKQIQDQWNAKTDELGRDKQLAAYKATLGVTR